MFLKYLVAGFIFLCATCCPEDDCAAVLCAGPPAIALRVLENGGNVFANETYTINDVVITGENSTEIILNIFENTDGTPILILDNFAWNIGENQYTLTFANDVSTELVIDITLSESGSCCGGIEQLRSFSSNGRVTEITNGYYTDSVR